MIKVEKDFVYTAFERGCREASTWGFYVGVKPGTDKANSLINFIDSILLESENDEVGAADKAMYCGEHNYMKVYIIGHSQCETFYNMVDCLQLEEKIVDEGLFYREP